FAQYPSLVDPTGFRLDRLTSVTVNGLARANYFKPTKDWPTGRVGLLTWDDPNYIYAFKHGTLPGLSRLGIKPYDARYIISPQQVQAFGDSAAAVSNAVLRFNSEHIDHVIIQDGASGQCGGTCLTLLFLQDAQKEHYYPRYGFNSYNK